MPTDIFLAPFPCLHRWYLQASYRAAQRRLLRALRWSARHDRGQRWRDTTVILARHSEAMLSRRYLEGHRYPIPPDCQRRSALLREQGYADA